MKKFKKGEFAKVVDNFLGHHYKIGAIVKILGVFHEDDEGRVTYKSVCRGAEDLEEDELKEMLEKTNSFRWVVADKEIEPTEEKW